MPAPHVSLAPLAAHADAVQLIRERNQRDFTRVGGGSPKVAAARGIAPASATGEERVRFAILDNGEVVGTGGLNRIARGSLQVADVGILLDAAARGRGVGTEAVRQLCDYGFGELGLHRLEAGIQPDNLASIRIFERNGFERIGLARGYLLIEGVWRDHLLLQKLAA